MVCRRTIVAAAPTAVLLVMMVAHPSATTADPPSTGAAVEGVAIQGAAIDGVMSQAARHVAAGEFRLARRTADRLPVEQRGAVLAQIALGQAATGDAVASARTVAAIADSATRTGVLSDLQHGAAGGGAVADFGSLMQLISSTIAPDSWDLQGAGGASTMMPYPGGILVDGDGVIRQTTSDGAGDRTAAIGLLLRHHGATDDNQDWTAAAPLRCVSLNRLAAELVRLRSAALPMPQSMRHLAGISDVRYLIIDRAGGDAVLAGPVGGIDLSGAWPRDRQSGQTPVELPYLTATLKAAIDHRPLGCSIDPTDQGISAAWDVAQQIRDDAIPLADAADRLSAALGRQRVTVFGTSGDTSLAWLLVEADRHMKQLALGQQAMPEGVANYLDMIDAHIAGGPPGDGQLLRMWFTAKTISIRADSERTVFQLNGLPLRLATESQIGEREGRQRAVPDDPRALAFAAQFNQHFSSIAAKHPVYAALASVYRAAGVAALLDRHAGSAWVQQICGPLLDDALIWPNRLPAPRHVDSIAVAHHVRHAGRRHHVLIASGGVSIDPGEVIASGVEVYPTLQSTRLDGDRPASIQRWWWDAQHGRAEEM